MRRLTSLLASLALSCAAPSEPDSERPSRGAPVAGWPEGVVEIRHESPADGSLQPALFFAPDGTDGTERAPLLVALHSWSSNYLQPSSVPYARWCVERGWAFIHPEFRGPNRRPEATGSELAVADIIAAVDWAKRHARIDEDRVYLVGVSGGGHAALLLAGRAPEIWAGVSAWVPIVDVGRWYEECEAAGRKYAGEIVASCGGVPAPGTSAFEEARRRSPATWLERARGTAIDIAAGIRDGHDGSVPIGHALEAFNILAAPEDRLAAEEIRHFVERAEVPPGLRAAVTDESFGERPPLFRRQSGAARITIFDGGHEIVVEAALGWLEKHGRRATR